MYVRRLINVRWLLKYFISEVSSSRTGDGLSRDSQDADILDGTIQSK